MKFSRIVATFFLPLSLAAAQEASSLVSPSSTLDLKSLVSELLPSATITSISPSESSVLLSDIPSYLSSYTAAHPLASLETEIGIGILLATSTPSAQQIASISSLVAGIETGIAAGPESYISQINAAVSPFGILDAVSSYESNVIGGLRTMVANDLQVSAPSEPSSTFAAPISGGSGVTSGASRSTGLREGGEKLVAASMMLAAAAVVGLAVI